MINAVKRRNTTALLFGKVVDFSGEPVSGAKVTMRLSAVPNLSYITIRDLSATTTDSDGRFQFENWFYVLPGEY